MTPAIEPNELLVGVRFPLWPAGHGFAFVEFARRHGDFAIASAAALLEGRRQDHARLGHVGGMAHGAGPRSEAEQALVGQAPTPTLSARACESCRKLEAIDDVHAPASYRQHLARCCRGARWRKLARARQPTARGA